MKKIISLFLTAILVCSFALTAVGADKEARQPDVYVNEVLVEFADQNAYITDEGRTLVPARGVFEALDCVVDWDADNYVVTVSKESQKKEIVLKIDNAEMKIITDGKETVKTLEVPAQLMNNRTMIPLRAVSEALGCAIIWNESEYSIRITEMKQISAEEFNEKLQMLFNASQNKDKEDAEEPEVKEPERIEQSIYLKASEGEVKAGDVISVSVMVSDVRGLQGAMFRVKWDASQLEMLGMEDDGNFVFEGYTDKPDLFESLSNINTDDVSTGVITVAGATLDSAAEYPEGEYCLGTLNFKVLEAAMGKTISLVFDESDNKTLANDGTRDILFAFAKGIDIVVK